MRRRIRHQHLIAEINITPFTDVILVLLIIFMITTPLIYQSSIPIALPTASAKEAINSDKPLNISVTQEGMVYVGRELVTRQELKSKVRAELKNNSNKNVFLFSDEQARVKEIVAIIDLLNELGVKNLNIATKVGQ